MKRPRAVTETSQVRKRRQRRWCNGWGSENSERVRGGAVGQPQRQRRCNGGEGERSARQGRVASEDARGGAIEQLQQQR
eukprot:scaffold22876_cov22-Phaeocystis_antarctica.AAC.1